MGIKENTGLVKDKGVLKRLIEIGRGYRYLEVWKVGDDYYAIPHDRYPHATSFVMHDAQSIGKSYEVEELEKLLSRLQGTAGR